MLIHNTQSGYYESDYNDFSVNGVEYFWLEFCRCLKVGFSKVRSFKFFSKLKDMSIWEEWLWESGPVAQGITLRSRRFPIQTPLVAQPGFGTQPRFFGMNIVLVRLLPWQWSKVGCEAAKLQIHNFIYIWWSFPKFCLTTQL